MSSGEASADRSGSRISAVKRLLVLPDAFSLATCATLLGVTNGAARVMLARWTAANYVQPSGSRTGFYFNVLKNRNAPDECLARAIKHIYPSAMVRGATVLHAAGKTTQVPHQIDVAVLGRADRAKTTGFSERAKPRRWYATLHGMWDKDGLFGLPALQPEAALADLYATEGDWHPDVDDLEVDELDWPKFKAACDILGIEVPEQLRDLVDAALEAHQKMQLPAAAPSSKRRACP